MDALATRAESAQAVLVGPGLMDAPASARMVQTLLQRLSKPKLILDADVPECACLDPAALRKARVPLAVTPHSRESAHMLSV